MAKTNSIPVEVLRQLLRYEPETGKLFWKIRDSSFFSAKGNRTSESVSRSWNGRCAGKEALSSLGQNGYLNGAIFSRHYLSHRVIWAMYYGEWPIDQIDHISGVSTDNKIENLRLATHSINAKNTKLRKTNKTGAMGVYWEERSQKWIARIRDSGKFVYLGSYKFKEEAILARKKAEPKYGFHPNHGRF